MKLESQADSAKNLRLTAAKMFRQRNAGGCRRFLTAERRFGPAAPELEAENLMGAAGINTSLRPAIAQELANVAGVQPWEGWAASWWPV